MNSVDEIIAMCCPFLVKQPLDDEFWYCLHANGVIRYIPNKHRIWFPGKGFKKSSDGSTVSETTCWDEDIRLDVDDDLTKIIEYCNLTAKKYKEYLTQSKKDELERDFV